MLYLIASPIGNLADLSFRALETLKKVDSIFCEDTRRSSILLKAYGIEKKLAPHHKFNERESLEEIFALLQNGKDVALLSDAGTPCINDPGSLLVQGCMERKIPFTLIPGPCSPINALVLSGFDVDRFQFIGFLPKKGLSETLRAVLRYPGTTVALESPERIVKSLEALGHIDAGREVAVVREMTKTFEECIRGTAHAVAAQLRDRTVLGEVCLVISKGDLAADSMSPGELVSMLQDAFGMDLKEAIRTAADLLKQPKREVYQSIHKN